MMPMPRRVFWKWLADWVWVFCICAFAGLIAYSCIATARADGMIRQGPVSRWGGGTAPPYNPTEVQVVWWKLNGTNAQGNFDDSSVNNIVLTNAGLVAVSNSYVVNDTSGMAQCIPNMFVTNIARSVSMWIRPHNIVINHGPWEEYIATGNVLSSFALSAGEFYWSAVVAVDGYEHFTWGVSNEWVHVCMVWDNATLSSQLYTNAILADTDANINEVEWDTTGYFYTVGARNKGANKFDGDIDDHRVWCRKLTATEVTNLYTGGQQ